ncbi:hypothetical protein QWI17_19710 [Gilvimarinus sp. SDUM040013]|uniref:Uncharacterized protein n=1 Tax=Gilvimarinus gilvus TaxID=3058038 RepID=A0ABU4S1D1_9GAMM|nr:hypothetical protein [Gilvimarinus sp. SDUM040013]MDO3388082.1 hypothetical protein [Gilvimarinus sp. SDUM040013]MDX6850990.1 hypothetical protein [Gilvimarinus sp. SDUM040013]
MNSKIIFSQAGIYRLQQLASLIYRHTGDRYRLSSIDGQLQLLKAAVTSPHPDVRTCCIHLADELHPQQLRVLATNGITLTSSSVLADKAG